MEISNVFIGPERSTRAAKSIIPMNFPGQTLAAQGLDRLGATHTTSTNGSNRDFSRENFFFPVSSATWSDNHWCILWSVFYALSVSSMYLFLSALYICVYCVLLYDMFIVHFCLMCWAHSRAPMSRIFRILIYVLCVCMYWLFVPNCLFALDWLIDMFELIDSLPFRTVGSHDSSCRSSSTRSFLEVSFAHPISIHFDFNLF